MHGRRKQTQEELNLKKKDRLDHAINFQNWIKKALDLKKNKCYDSEGLELTRILLLIISDFYTMWNFRKEIVEDMICDKNEDEIEQICRNELVFVENCLKKHPRSHATWYHRYWVLKHIPHLNWKEELRQTEYFLLQDVKNFNTWDYRRFVMKKAQLPLEEELHFINNKIKRFYSNYTTWQYRSQILSEAYSFVTQNGVPETILQDEFQHIQHDCLAKPNDIAPWLFHRWLLKERESLIIITHAHISRNLRKATIVFSHKIVLSEHDNLKAVIFSDGQPIPSTWQNIERNSYPSALWITYLPVSILRSMDHKFEIMCTNINGSVLRTGQMILTERAEVWYVNENFKNIFNFNYSGVPRTFFESQKSWCQELIEVNPNKLAILSAIFLFRIIDASKYHNEIGIHFDTLIQIDPDRFCCYNDLRSRFTFEDAILEVHKKESRQFRVIDKALTNLFHTQYLYHMVLVDLSRNLIDSLASLCTLQCVEILILDDNRILSCEGLENLGELQHLSLKDNYIIDEEAVLPLISCKMLNRLELLPNPICEKQSYHIIKEILPNLIYLDGVQINIPRTSPYF